MPRYTFTTDAQATCGRDLSRAAIFLLGEYVADQDVLFDLDLALTEAAANVVRHAYGEGCGALEISVDIQPGSHAVLEVADTGAGIDASCVTFETPDPTSECGRGFFLMKKLTDQFEILRDGDRNVIRMRKNIGKEAWVRSS